MVCVAALRLLAWALAEFPLPRPGYPCLLLDPNARQARRESLDELPWSELYAAVRAQAEAAPRRRDPWLAHAARMRAAAVAWALSGETRCAGLAAGLLAYYPTALTGAPRSCRDLSLVTFQWAQTYDLMRERFAHRPQYASAPLALAGLARRLYYTTHGMVCREERPEVSWVWRACALTACGVALAGTPLPAEYGTAQAWYAEGRKELRRCLPRCLSPALVREGGADGLADLCRLVVPLAVALKRVTGEELVDPVVWQQCRDWVLATRLADGSRLDWGTGSSSCFPVHLLAAYGPEPEALAWDARRANRLPRNGDVVDALCLFPAVEAKEPAEQRKVAQFGDALALRSAWDDGASLLLLGPLAPAATQTKYRRIEYSAPLAGAWAGQKWTGRLFVSCPAPRGRAEAPARLPAPGRPSGLDVEAFGWAPGGAPVCAGWTARGQGLALGVDYVLAEPGVCIIRPVSLDPAFTADVRVEVAEDSSARVFLARTPGDAPQGGPLVRGATHGSVALAGGKAGSVTVIACHDRAVRLACRGPELGLEIEAARGDGYWRVGMDSGHESPEVSAAGLAVGSDFIVSRYTKGGQVEGVLLVGASQMTADGEVLWQSEASSNIWWTPGAGPLFVDAPGDPEAPAAR